MLPRNHDPVRLPSRGSRPVLLPVRSARVAVLLLLPLLLVASPGSAQTVSRKIEHRGKPYRPDRLVLPYAFYSEAFSFALGLGATGSGLLGQEHFSGFAAGSAGINGSWSVIAGGWGLRLGHRVFLDPRLLAGGWVEPQLYVDGNPDFPHERAGSNGSSEDNFIDGAQDMGWATADLRFILPLGHGRDTVVTTYWLDDGLLADGAGGGSSGTPLRSGRSSIVLTPSWRNDDVEWSPAGLRFRTLNLRLALEWDNRDFVHNPSRGSFQRVAFSRDGSWVADTETWSFWELELRKFVDLGKGWGARQRVLALNFWTGNSPSWTEHDGLVSHRPPFFTGATLGGFFKMRAHPTNRFHGKSVAYYAAEYRHLLAWNPVSGSPTLRKLEIDWFQLVAFVELGRVDERWVLDSFIRDLHWDAGLGLRAMIRRFVVRMDFAVSSRSSRFTMMAGPSF